MEEVSGNVTDDKLEEDEPKEDEEMQVQPETLQATEVRSSCIFSVRTYRRLFDGKSIYYTFNCVYSAGRS